VVVLRTMLHYEVERCTFRMLCMCDVPPVQPLF